MSNSTARLHSPPVHLRYGNDRGPGIRRRTLPGGQFEYIDVDGSLVRSPDTLARIRALAIPPAYQDVWISPLPNSHLQATARDRRGRKQYRYHEAWRRERDAKKFAHMLAFGEALPAIRAHVRSDLSRSGLPREKVLATLVRLLETTLIRVGNEEYARANRSFGLTTMRIEHVDIEGSKLHFSFRGKSGKHHEIDLRSPSLAKIVARCKELPGRDVFEYVDSDSGEVRTVRSEDVNGYIQDVAGSEFTAEDFRTWAGTLIAFSLLCACRPCRTNAEIRHELAQAVEQAAQRLGNTPSVCRKSYIHPDLLVAFEEGNLSHESTANVDEQNGPGLRGEEAALLSFLRGRAASVRRTAV